MKARALLRDFPYFAEACLKIRPKEGGLKPFRLNAVQRAIHARLEAQRAKTGRVRALILKARQPGCSTYVEGRFYWKVTRARGVRAYILAHSQETTDNLFAIVSRFHEHCPEPVRPRAGAANARELRFAGLDSGYRVGTAGSRAAGVGSTVQFFHGSEVARWPNADEHMSGVMQAVPGGRGTEIILESTAFGIGGMFYDLCKAAEAGQGDYELIFLPWHWHEEYREAPPAGWRAPAAFAEYGRLHALDEAQVHWAWRKNAELALAIGAGADEICWKFRQEYPATPEEAFQAGGGETFIKAESVLRARRFRAPDQAFAPLVIGVDVAAGGRDLTWMIDRQGRVAGGLLNRTLDTDDQMEIAGHLAREIERLNPMQVFIDVGGGYGSGVYDRLRERGFGRKLTPVQFGAKARDERAYANKRAEMWGEMRAWLNDPGGAEIPDDDLLHRHLLAPGFKLNSNDQIVLEPKDKIRERLGLSPDGGDALALTFAESVRRGREHARPESVARNYDPHSW